MLKTRWVLALACLYGRFAVCLAFNQRKQTELSDDGAEYPDDRNMVAEDEKGNRYRLRRGGSGEPAEYLWDWGHFKMKNEENGKRSQIETQPVKANVVQIGQRKTIIPLEGIVFAKVKNNHLVKPKLTSRLFSTGHKYKTRIPIKRKLGTLSRRFDLYPRWFSNSIPPLFGKHFAQRYYKPYRNLQTVQGQTRHHINGRHRKRGRSGSVFHELPLSWMTGDSRDEIPKRNRGESMYEYGGYDGKNFDETKLEGMEADDGMVMNPQSASKARHMSEMTDKKSLPFLKDIPREVMAELNPYEYTVVPEHDGAHRTHHLAAHTRGVHTHALEHGSHVQQTTRELETVPTPHEGWTDYHSLPLQHHHRTKLNPCYRNPCLNHGRCNFNNQGNFRCQCKRGFNGDICDRTRFSCHPNPCYNGGTCTMLQTGYFCTCLPGFRGHDCDGQNPCASNPCQNNGRCTDTAEGFFCTCAKGYSGHTCGGLNTATTRLDDVGIGGTTIECPLGACLNGGNCVKTATHTICNCPPGHHGARCEERRRTGGHVIVPSGVPAGPSVANLGVNTIHSPIQHVHNLPLSNAGCTLNCRNGGKCTKSIAGYSCTCPAGFNGEFCENMVGLALREQRLAGGLRAGGHQVRLYNGYPMKHYDCLMLACKNGGTCMATIINDNVRHICTCPTGFEGEDCGNLLPMTTVGGHSEVGTHDIALNGLTCAPGVCKNGGTCVKQAGGAGGETHICTCPAGFGGDDCGSPDLCNPNPCENGGTCAQEGEENYKCTCLSGFKGLDCNLPNHCTQGTCKNNGICEETPDSFHCKCLTGFRGADCALASACQANPCSNKGVCVEKGSGFSCNCPTGFVGSTCDIKDSCFPNPCGNGICHDDNGITICNCTHGWSGRFCDSADLCSSSPCLNGGSCSQVAGDVKCQCAPGFQGSLCELPDSCHSNPCENNGHCELAGTAFMCKCPDGFHGERCHLKAHCQPSPCNSHGECFESDEGFICECNPRYMGKFCEVTRNCFDNPCLNGGHCMESGQSFICQCPFGYRGKSCSVNVCDSHPCLNGGTCIPAENDVGFGCECVFPYHGVTCGEMDPCLTNPCRNGGTCQSQLQGGVLTGVSPHMSVFGPYDCGPYDTDNHCGAMAHRQDRYDGHQEPVPKPPYPAYEAKAIEAKPDRYPAMESDKDAGRFDKDRDVGFFDKDMSQFSKDADKDVHFDKTKNVFDATKDIEKDTRPPSAQGYNPDKDRSTRGDASGATDIGKDIHIPMGKGFQADADKDGSQDEGKDRYSSKDWPIEARNDHAGLLDKVDYYPKHQPESSKATSLPPCPCNPQPCTWPPTCQPQGCTPPCKRHFDENEQRRFEDTYHKRSLSSSHNHSTDVRVSRTTIPRSTVKNIYAKKLNTLSNGTVVEKRNTKHHSSKDITKLSIKEILALKRDVIIDVKASKRRLEIIPKVIINFRHPGETDVYKRTMHELYVCQCPPGFLGAHCQHMNPCRASPCTNGGSCIPRGDRYICQCLPGFGGRHCDDPHPCTPNPCIHGGKCRLAKSVRGYECKCKSGWRGYNCEDRDNCALNNPCRHDGTCINIDGSDASVECKCRTRYSGKHCEIDTCAACDMNAYCHHGNCVCEAGYFGNGFRCKAMTDICTPNPCDNKGECKPGLDGKLFSCECQSGYVGTRCELPHPCANNPCLHNGACVDESNSKDRGILLLDRNDYKCFCSAGYKGKNCGETSLAACSSGPCQHNGTCFDSSSETHSKHLTHSEDYECFCALGFTGKNCEINHFACYSYPCMNGGTCLDAESLPDINFDAHGYKCNCNHGFIGRNCEVTVYGPGACHQSPCLNNGRCLDAMNSNDPDIHFDYEHQFKCICPPQYSGKICEVPYPACFSNPCRNKGLCSDRSKEPGGSFDENGYTCTCLAGYDGRNCERQNSLAINEDVEIQGTHDMALEGKIEAKPDEEIHEDSRLYDQKKDDDLEQEIKAKFQGTSMKGETPDVETLKLLQKLSYPNEGYSKVYHQKGLTIPLLNPRPSIEHRNIGNITKRWI